jgi:hypothetical protein
MKKYFIFLFLYLATYSQPIGIVSELKFNSLKIKLETYIGSDYILMIKNSPFLNDTVIQFQNDTNNYRVNFKKKIFEKISPFNKSQLRFKEMIGKLKATESSKTKKIISFNNKMLDLKSNDEKLNGSLYYASIDFLNVEMVQYFAMEMNKIIDTDFNFPKNTIPLRISLSGEMKNRKIELSYKVKSIEENISNKKFIKDVLSFRQ